MCENMDGSRHKVREVGHKRGLLRLLYLHKVQRQAKLMMGRGLEGVP